MSKQMLLVVLVGLLALLGGLKARHLISNSSAQSQNLALPTFTLTDLSGTPHPIDEWKGKFRIINFWATWCPPCLKEMPAFNALNKDYASQGVQFIGIALDDAEPVQEFIGKNKIDYPILLGGDGGIKLSQSLGNLVGTVPFTVFVDKSGQIVKTHMGELDKDELIEIIQRFNR